MNLPRTLDNEKLDQSTSGPIPQSLKQTAGGQDGFIYRFHDNVYNLYSLWLNSKLVIVFLSFNQDFYFKNLWNIFRNALLIWKLLAVHLWEKLFINSKLFTLQKNLTRVHLWWTFACHWRRVARVGYCGLSIKINTGIWLVGDTDTPW